MMGWSTSKLRRASHGRSSSVSVPAGQRQFERNPPQGIQPRVGGAAFFDAGRAWGGDNVNTTDPGWLSNLGVGLRIFSVRAAFSNVLHIDVAFPLIPNAGLKKVQFLVKTKASF